MTPRLGIAVLISGRGTNLQAIIDAIADGALPVELKAVISNEPGAPGIARARAAGYETAIVHHREFSSREGSFLRAGRRASRLDSARRSWCSPDSCAS